ncbi:putative oxidoreductase [Fusarium oxysporum]|nr:putative oxidoreductase [Fusarium oxysporum]
MVVARRYCSERNHPDLDDLEKFAVDFGLIEAWHSDDIVLYRGYSKDPYCYVAHKAPADIAAFGDGRIVTLKTPSGFLFHVLYGQDEILVCESVSSAVVDNLGPFNRSINKQRLGKFVFFFVYIMCSNMQKRADSWVQASSSGFTLGHLRVTRPWGVGRHILGPQIFDYCRDPSEFIIEHYTDGDLVNVHTGTKRGTAGPLSV